MMLELSAAWKADLPAGLAGLLWLNPAGLDTHKMNNSN